MNKLFLIAFVMLLMSVVAVSMVSAAYAPADLQAGSNLTGPQSVAAGKSSAAPVMNSSYSYGSAHGLCDQDSDASASY